MPELKDVLEAVEKEVKSIGDGFTAVKKLTDSMNTDLKSVRDLAEKAGKDINGATQVANDVKALAEGVAAKHDAIATQVKSIEEKSLKGANDRIDELEKKLNRSKLSGMWGNEDDGVKAAKQFAQHAAIIRGESKGGVLLPEDKIDLEAVAAYCKSFPTYLRRDDKGGVGSAEAKAMSVGSDPDGGYTVTPTIGAIIQGVQFETSPMRAIANIETISSDAIEYPRDDDQASVGWVGEQEDRPATATPQAGMQRIPVHELYAMPKVTQKLLEDSAWNIEAWLGTKIGDRFGRTEATAFVSGNGVKRPRGFTSYASGTYAAGGSGKIEQVAAGTAAAVGWDDLINLLTSLKEFYLSGAVWMMQRATVGRVMLLKDGEGRYIWQTNSQAGKPSVLIGYEVRQAADMDAVGATKLPVAFGNFKMGYTIVDRLGISTLRDPYTAKPFVQFYTRKRVGGDVTNFEAIKLLAT